MVTKYYIQEKLFLLKLYCECVSKKRQIKYKRIGTIQYLQFSSEKRVKIFYFSSFFFLYADHYIIIDGS
ncbi:hypothetical protein ACI65C_000398 [Semiaphis heraclei]